MTTLTQFPQQPTVYVSPPAVKMPPLQQLEKTMVQALTHSVDCDVVERSSSRDENNKDCQTVFKDVGNSALSLDLINIKRIEIQTPNELRLDYTAAADERPEARGTTDDNANVAVFSRTSSRYQDSQKSLVVKPVIVRNRRYMRCRHRKHQ